MTISCARSSTRFMRTSSATSSTATSSARRANVPLEQKELEADRFAGYTLWRLNVKRFDAADTERYYQAVGDDYVGAQDSHGTGAQRTTAFQEGWDLARTGAREDSAQRPAGGLD